MTYMLNDLINTLHQSGLSQIAILLTMWLENATEKQQNSLVLALDSWNEESKTTIQKVKERLS